MRFDNNNEYGNFILPRFALLYKLSNHFTIRLGGGFGCTIPTVFACDVDERDYPNIFLIKDENSNLNLIYFYDAAQPINTKGFEPYVAATHNAFEYTWGTPTR